MKQGLKTLRGRASTVHRGLVHKGKISGFREAGGTSIIQRNTIIHCTVKIAP